MTLNRQHLADALVIGCLAFAFGDSYPLASATGKKYVWMPLESSALPLDSERPTTPAIVYCSDQPL
jgi:hypothetical protein